MADLLAELQMNSAITFMLCSCLLHLAKYDRSGGTSRVFVRGQRQGGEGYVLIIFDVCIEIGCVSLQ